MKKLALLLVAALAFTGLVATSGAATAAPYPGTVRTTSVIKAPAKVKHGKKVKISVVVKAGNAKPVGKVTLLVKRGGNVVRKLTVAVKNGVAKFTVHKLKKGTLTLKASYAPKKGSVYKKSSAKAKKLRVV